MTDDLDTFTAGIQAARDAYNADEAVRAGICAICQTNKTKTNRRRCLTCQRAGLKEQP